MLHTPSRALLLLLQNTLTVWNMITTILYNIVTTTNNSIKSSVCVSPETLQCTDCPCISDLSSSPLSLSFSLSLFFLSVCVCVCMCVGVILVLSVPSSNPSDLRSVKLQSWSSDYSYWWAKLPSRSFHPRRSVPQLSPSSRSSRSVLARPFSVGCWVGAYQHCPLIAPSAAASSVHSGR